jgi:hypothetical protein
MTVACRSSDIARRVMRPEAGNRRSGGHPSMLVLVEVALLLCATGQINLCAVDLTIQSLGEV